MMVYTDVGLIAAWPRDIQSYIRDAWPHRKGHSALVLFSIKSSETIEIKHKIFKFTLKFYFIEANVTLHTLQNYDIS